MSFMEKKIPGPRTELAHGNFYSTEVADAIGVTGQLVIIVLSTQTKNGNELKTITRSILKKP